MRLKTEEEDSAALENNNNVKTNRGRKDDRADVEVDGDEGKEDNGDEKVVNNDNNHFDLRKFITSFINYDRDDNGD